MYDVLPIVLHDAEFEHRHVALLLKLLSRKLQVVDIVNWSSAFILQPILIQEVVSPITRFAVVKNSKGICVY